MHGQEKALSPVGTAPALAEKTTSVELAGRAEKATATKLEVLEHGTYHKAGPRHDTPPQGEARHEVETPLREGKGEFHVLPVKESQYSVVLYFQVRILIIASATNSTHGVRNLNIHGFPYQRTL